MECSRMFFPAMAAIRRYRYQRLWSRCRHNHLELGDIDIVHSGLSVTLWFSKTLLTTTSFDSPLWPANHADNPPISVIPLDRRYSITSFIARSYAFTATSKPLPLCSSRSQMARIVARVLSSGIVILHQTLTDYDASRQAE